jgi:diguanylate cyclase (GGDEF)-like protein/PAS domain S-box-containing protein
MEEFRSTPQQSHCNGIGNMIALGDSGNSDQTRAIQRVGQLYAALSRINRAIVRVTTRDELFASICEILVEFGKFDLAWIGWNDPVDSSVKVVGQFGDVHGYLPSIRVRSDESPEGCGPVGLAIREGRPYIAANFQQSPLTQPWHAAAARCGFKASAAFPIRMGSQVCGALAVYAAELDFFGPQETELLLDTATDISFALDHLESEQRRVRAEQSVRESEARLRTIIETEPECVKLLAPDGSLLEMNPAGLRMIEADSLAQVQNHCIYPLVIEEYRAAFSDLNERVMRGESGTLVYRIIGLKGTERWMETHVSPLRDDSGQVTSALGVTRDISDRKRAEKRQTALLQISEAAHSTSTLLEMFGRIHQIIGELLPARNFFVALYDRTRDELSFPYYVDEHDEAPEPRKPEDGTLSGRVIMTGEPLLFTPDTLREGGYEQFKLVGTDSMDWLGVPLKSQSHTIGALVVQSYSGDVRYVEKDKVLLEFVSSQVAAAIERRQAADALLISEKRFRLLFEQNLAGVFRSLPDGQLLECNDAFARMLGYESREEIIGVNSKSFYFEDNDRERYLAYLREHGSVDNSVVRLRRRDAAEFWGMQTVNLILDDPSHPEVMQGTLLDFSERKQAEQALQKSESRLEEAQRLGHLGSWAWDLATSTLNWSDELCRIYGVSPGSHRPTYEDFLGRIHAEDRAAAQALVAQAMLDRKPFNHEIRIVRPDGEIRTICDQSEVLVDDQGRITGLAGACLDITDRKLEDLLEQDRSLILEQVAQNRPLPDILSRISIMLEKQIPGSRSSVLLLKDGRHWTGAAPHLPQSYCDQLHGLPIGPAAGSCGTAMFRRETVIVEDIVTDLLWDGYRELALPHGLRACWSMPIPSNRGDVLGSFALYRDHPSRPSARDLEFMSMATRLAAVAMEHRLLTDQLEHQAHHDALTGLPNRLLFQDRLNQILAQAGRKKQQVAVLYMDLDRFKSINDLLGHSSGDALLCQAASRLQACIRSTDTLARLGGDEFTVVLTELSNPQDAIHVAAKLIEAMRAPFHVDQHELFVTLSLGISVYPEDGLDSSTLMANADAAMYRAKETGRDNFQWFAAEMNTVAKERMSMDGQLRHALRLGQLSLHYQPQCSADGEIQGFEALMRWQHPILGMVSPARFIPLAEASGMIVALGEWALRTACAQTVAWHKAGHPNLRVAVTVSAVQFKRADWVDTVRVVLHDTQLAPGALELEITESLLLHNLSEASANLFELRDLGVGIAIDDFGTGYSSLSYLHKLPVTTLKIDQAFVHEIGHQSLPGQEEAPIIRTIIALARNLGMGVVAEGVETNAQRDLLLSLGCESLQGYLLHRPMPVEQIDLLLLQAADRTGPGVPPQLAGYDLGAGIDGAARHGTIDSA